MGFTSTFKFVTLGARTRIFRKFRGQPPKTYDLIRNQIDRLLREGRIELTLPRAKELQQYAEEIIFHAKRDCRESDLIVESVLRTPESRSLLYEKYVPLYKDRRFFFTRVVNQWRLRFRDSAPMAYLELVDRPNELRPAKPVGNDKISHVYSLMKNSRRDFRKYYTYAKKVGLIDETGNLVENLGSIVEHDKKWFENEDNISTVDEAKLTDESIKKRLETIRSIDLSTGTAREVFDTTYTPNNGSKTSSRVPRFNP
ncbi:60S ribosomal protein L17, putative [Theileria equi strain WA]|uniref:60S ribosomal protein L17, putative n=1 Tax=Theileria equi strain WA TaxID=1537102 RepID=L1LF11_THEEQ|nr:60S ribosomal protein L17, putative [Theileria equi strain WA]EKX73743.1 60S ribosomal protein L17, putative [Theileria equi strain WA]|eukprot:XP_004833195.1 60S ribosomal protein L17, putative [Theileria equi strain WA]